MEINDAYDMGDLIRAAIENHREEFENPVQRIMTFSEAGLTTRNEGLVIRTQDGKEFQITIVQSK